VHVRPEAVNLFEKFHGNLERQRRDTGLLDTTRRVIWSKLDKAALCDAGNPAVVNVDRLVQNDVQTFRSKPVRRRYDIVNGSQTVDKFSTSGVVRNVTSHVYGSFAA
jgi:hypothetical protein